MISILNDHDVGEDMEEETKSFVYKGNDFNSPFCKI